MAYFPAFVNLDNKKILIIGGGLIAKNKLIHLLDFTSNITLISKDFIPENISLINENSLAYFEGEYKKDDIKGFDIVIAAIDNVYLQESIYFETRNENCLYNCVDIQKYCDFIFPSYIKKGDLTIAISTSGSSPSMAKNIRIWLERIIPNSIIDFLIKMKSYRKTIPKGKERMKFLDQKAKEYIDSWKE